MTALQIAHHVKAMETCTNSLLASASVVNLPLRPLVTNYKFITRLVAMHGDGGRLALIMTIRNI